MAMHGYIGVIGGPYGGHEWTVGCLRAKEWSYGSHGWIVGYLWFGFCGKWIVDEIEREVGLVGMEDENMGMVVWMGYEVTWAAWWWYGWVVRLHGLHGGAIDELWVIRGSHELCGGLWVIMWLHGWGVRESLSCIWAMERLWDGKSAWVVCMLCAGCVQAVCGLCAGCARPMCQSTHYGDLIIKSVSIKLPYSLLLLFVMLLKNFCIKTAEKSCFPHPN